MLSTVESLRVEGLRTTVGASDLAGATVEALRMVGVAGDHDKYLESIDELFSVGAEVGRPVEPYVYLPEDVVNLSLLMRIASNRRYEDGKPFINPHVDSRVWFAGSEAVNGSDLDGLSRKDGNVYSPHVRFAVLNLDVPSEQQFLHFVGERFSDVEGSQLASLDIASEEYDSEGNTGFELTALNVKSLVWMSIVRRIMGEPLPIPTGFSMRDATLEKRSIELAYIVPRVKNNGGRLALDGVHVASTDDRSGIGMSIGPKSPKPLMHDQLNADF